MKYGTAYAKVAPCLIAFKKGSKLEYESYIKTAKWKAISLEVKERAGHKCRLCNSGSRLETHHRSYDHLGEEENHMNDLTCLCRKCHRLFHKNVKITHRGRITKGIKKEIPKYAKGNGDIKLNRKKIMDCRTYDGGFSKKIIEALGVSYPPPKGWTRKLVGTTISKDQFRLAFRAKDV